ncbi:class I SAM-dependent methyltransferase [Amylibacter sp. SFDW26]|uniref:class I SAM-dependent methyltransferase n=1 Tax=Amylibacter sp. SFDW26 TaxID=2652722 RepID=UPI001261EDE4|nr:class I SAM-dependent methyltransferase [Amylibacter sp. SFDW26]KAB7615584.1 class I SAM-dependent methyltransferase [Amylibacter sp. SFDW26]
MNTDEVKSLAKQNTPIVRIQKHPNLFRHNVVDELTDGTNFGIELGVASGVFSKRMMDSGKFRQFYGVDVYADTHDTEEYKKALKHIGIRRNYKLLRMTFDDAIDLFKDDFFDFIYVDGYAHTGEEGGTTLIKWYQKLKPGGIMAGDDYHDDWPLVKWAVNHFASQLDKTVNVTGKTEHSGYSKYPSWFMTKPLKGISHINMPEKLINAARKERTRIDKERFMQQFTK